MNVSYVNQELNAIQSRTRKFMGASALSHVIFFLFAFLMHSISPGADRLVEINWIESVEIIPAVAKTMSPSQKTALERTSSRHETREHFVRETAEADVAPRPQSTKAAEDKLNKKLMSLQNSAIGKNLQIATVTQPSGITKPSLAGMSAKKNVSGDAVELTRNPTGGTKPMKLQRTPVTTARPVIAGIRTPEVETAPEPAKADDSTARRTLAGALLTGPVADRPLLSYETPIYPEWAKREGVEGSSTIYFVVLPDGRIKKNVVVQKTAGFEDFDHNAIESILAWRFEPLRGNTTGEQWGTIKFHFRLNDMRSN